MILQGTAARTYQRMILTVKSPISNEKQNAQVVLRGQKEYNNSVLKITRMCMLDEIRAKRDEIYAVARAHKAEKLWVFGSCARKEETPESDVDFLVKFGKDVGHRDYTAIENFCSSLLGRSIDIVSTSVLRGSPRFANRVCREAVAV